MSFRKEGSEETSLDAQEWLRRWDRQQERHLPRREESLGHLVLLAEDAAGERGRVLDLACGCGSVTARIRQACPDALIVGVDIDPVLRIIARGVFAGDTNVRLVDRDLRDARWAADFAPGSFDAVVTATALHWLEEKTLQRLYRDLALLLRPGGVFANADHMPLQTPLFNRIGEEAARAHYEGSAAADAPDWVRWWEEIAREPAMAEAMGERERRFGAEAVCGVHALRRLASGSA